MKITLKDNGIYGDGWTIAVGEKNENGSVTWIEGRLDFANRFCPFAEPKDPRYFEALCAYIRRSSKLDLIIADEEDDDEPQGPRPPEGFIDIATDLLHDPRFFELLGGPREDTKD